MKNKPIAVPSKTAQLISDLHEALQKQFGCDFAYSIMGNGKFVAASNMKDGLITPTCVPSPDPRLAGLVKP